MPVILLSSVLLLQVNFYPSGNEDWCCHHTGTLAVVTLLTEQPEKSKGHLATIRTDSQRLSHFFRPDALIPGPSEA